MNKTLWLSSLLIVASNYAPAFAQGGDECSGAASIAGSGPHTFDQTLATASADPSMCGTLGIDVWFSWTAGQTADHVLSLCGGASHDTKIAVYDGCGGAELQCNDDACGLQSSLTFNAVSGNTYLIRIGTFGSVPGGLGSFDITPDLPVINPSNGHAYKVIPAFFVDWTTARDEAALMMFNGIPGHLVTFSDQAEIDWALNNLPVTRPWIGLFQDTTAAGYSEPNGGWTWVTGEPFTFTNWAAGEPNDTGATGLAEDYVEMFGSGVWNDTEQLNNFTDSYIVEWDGGGSGAGTTFCDPAANNSAGAPAALAGSWGTGVGSDLHLEVTSGVPGQLTYLLVGNEATPGIPVSNGLFCLVGTATAQFFRFNVAGTDMNSIGGFDATGTMINAAGTSTTGFGYDVPNTIPATVPITIMAGDTWHFQAWYRDTPAGVGSSNFTNGLSVTF